MMAASVMAGSVHLARSSRRRERASEPKGAGAVLD
jgi:hypothetical protein